MTANILTVDDSASMRMTTRLALSGAGYAVTEAVDGLDGLDKAKTRRFDAIITDINMPRMDGLKMIEEVRRLSTQVGVPIVFLTTESDAGMKARAKAAGATAWLTKPFDAAQLLKLVAKVVGS
ncbi:two-component system, chemotaxis family, response regulator CheY [Rhodoblastus acidophilus]|uniref:Two-component system, chemotaxis family, response regulator CheY n=2 Tax=Rhodoblastus acidophilus TaxID=1074 RepID=A0A212SI57_RHOAC|nr:response regulator [Rhodoblastus acidophilus]PPQ36119.1 response regulator [Rhodoblastus acidophilus]RAI16270.1 response regulator [Rhodoblastus acidophilus]SNB85365.1 two-component system, chemotaxis family, response regulator CheY [Rhodoblastus acidophilus]